MHVQTCYYHEGKHYGPAGCYHETVTEPQELQPGWSVQTAQRENRPYLEEKHVSNERPD